MVPTEPRAVAKYEQACSIEYAQWDPIVSTIAAEKVFKLRYGQATNEALVAELIPRLEIKLDGYEAILSKQKYLAGDVSGAKETVREWCLTDGFLTSAGTYSRGPVPSAVRYDYIRRSQAWRSG